MKRTTRGLLVSLAGLTVLRQLPPAPPNPHDLPQGEPIRKTLLQWFRIQRKEILGTMPAVGTGEVPTKFSLTTDYNDRMASAMTPILGVYWQEAGKEVRERLGLDPDEWKVTDPNLAKAIEAQAFDFCEATNKTTDLELSQALAKLRAELKAGILDEGETLKQLTDRVQGIFDNAERYRARRIAATEASRALHSAEVLSAAESGVVAGFEWLASGDACPICQQIAAKAPRVKLGDRFAEIGDHPTYKDIRHPPAHPHCQCSLLEVLLPEYGGPESVEWAKPLIQPKPEGWDGEVAPVKPKRLAVKPIKPKPEPKAISHGGKTKPPKTPKQVAPKRWTTGPIESRIAGYMDAEGEALRQRLLAELKDFKSEPVGNIGKQMAEHLAKNLEKRAAIAGIRQKLSDDIDARTKRIAELEALPKPWSEETKGKLAFLYKANDHDRSAFLKTFDESNRLDTARQKLEAQIRGLERTQASDVVKRVLGLPEADQVAVNRQPVPAHLGQFWLDKESTPNLSSKQEKNYEHAAAFIRAITAKSGLHKEAEGGVTVQVMEFNSGRAKGQRAYCHSPGRFLGAVHVAAWNEPRVMAHEIGHQVEIALGAEEAATAWVWHRTRNTPAIKMNRLGQGYSDDEVGNEDEFGSLFGGNRNSAAYLGKTYKNGQTEVLSMLTELLYADPAQLCKDPEAFGLLIGILRDRIR